MKLTASASSAASPSPLQRQILPEQLEAPSFVLSAKKVIRGKMSSKLTNRRTITSIRNG